MTAPSLVARVERARINRERPPERRRGPAPIPAEARFDDKVDRSGECWLWTATRNQFGYGQFWVGTGWVGAHRYAYEREHGPIPAGRDLMHDCDNPPCVRPSHLHPGTRSENLKDMVRRGRGRGQFKPSEAWVAAHPIPA